VGELAAGAGVILRQPADGGPAHPPTGGWPSRSGRRSRRPAGPRGRRPDWPPSSRSGTSDWSARTRSSS